MINLFLQKHSIIDVWQFSVYVSGSKYSRVLNMLLILNIPALWICLSQNIKKFHYAGFWIYLSWNIRKFRFKRFFRGFRFPEFTKSFLLRKYKSFFGVSVSWNIRNFLISELIQDGIHDAFLGFSFPEV